MKNPFLLLIFFFILTNVDAQTVNLPLEKFGAKADGVSSSDGTIVAGSNEFVCKTCQFNSKDIGKTIYISGAAKGGTTLTAKIKEVNSSIKIFLDIQAATSVQKADLTYGTDCTAAFLQWNNVARSMRNNKLLLSMQQGTYLTSFNNWLAGVRDVIIRGNNTNIICTHGASDVTGSNGSNEGLTMPSCFNNVDNNYSSYKFMSDVSYGYKIASVQKGKNYILTKTVSEASEFMVGNWILIYGLHEEDFGGFPPDPRFFEYARIKSINKRDGRIYLDRKLKNNYDSDWPDGTQKSGVGAPRILNLNRKNFNAIENITIQNINFLPFNCWRGKLADSIRNGRFVIYGYINATVKNVTAPAAYLGQGKSLTVDGAHFKYQCEPDKALDSVTIKNSTIHDFANGTGLNYLCLIGNRFSGEFNASPRTLYIIRNYFETRGGNSTSMATVGFNKGTNYIKIGKNTWNCTDPQKTTLFSEPGSTKLTVERVINNNMIITNFNHFVSAKNSRQVLPGSVGRTSSGKQIKVSKISRSGDDAIAIQGLFSAPPSQGDEFIFSYAPNIEVLDKQITIGPAANIPTVFISHNFVYKYSYRSIPTSRP